MAEIDYTIEINPITEYTIELNEQGPQGATGPAGTNATITEVTASVDNNTGEPYVDVTMGGTASTRTFDFAFHNLKGTDGQGIVDSVNNIIPDGNGNVTLTASDVGAYASDNPNGYISGISSSDVTTALGYTPVNPTNLSTVATSGSYADLSNKPSIPTATSDLINDSGYIDLDDVPLHALKSYEDAGELLTDAEGLADVKYYVHSSFDLSKFTITGSPTITNDGIASGFSSGNYVDAGTTFNITNADSWEVRGEFTTGNDISTQQYIFSLKDSDTVQTSGICFGGSPTGCRAFIGDSDGQILNADLGTMAVSANTKYSYKVTYDSTNGYKFYLGLYNGALSLVSSNSNTRKLNYGTTEIWVGRYNPAVDLRPYLGTIDLKQFSITADNVLVFSGNKTGVDTYTINSSIVTIPYTLSKTGSKIADSVYRTQVASVYSEFGCAPYYTLSDSDFTLPQGEIYGMLSDYNFAPSEKFINLTLGASGTEYTAPANGWYFIRKDSNSSSTQNVTLINITPTRSTSNPLQTSECMGARSVSTANAQAIMAYLPVKKGDIVEVTYTAGGNVDAFKFIYAQGSEREAQ